MKSLLITLFLLITVNANSQVGKINRKAVVDRHQIAITQTNPGSPAQVGNGKFAFSMDVTGLQTFVPFNTLSDWGWHSFPLPEGLSSIDFKESTLNTFGREIPYCIPNPEQPELSGWLAGNPHRFNLGRIGFRLLKSNGEVATEKDLNNISQITHLWTGIIESRFEFEGKGTVVRTMCHPAKDMVGVDITSDLFETGQISVFVDFPYTDQRLIAEYVGIYSKPLSHQSVVEDLLPYSALISRVIDTMHYYVSFQWEQKALFQKDSDVTHRFNLSPAKGKRFRFSCSFSTSKAQIPMPQVHEIEIASAKSWKNYWMSGAAIDFSQSKDGRWKELERRIILSQYLMRLNEAGLYPPQESGLVNNGWYGRFHFEMIWWHGVHYGLWNRWDLFDRYLKIYTDFLPTSKERAGKQNYKGARWPKCTGFFDREWPHPIHATLIWQQPHPIYFAEMDYRLHPDIHTLQKWKDIVFNTANFMADYVRCDSSKSRYVLGPPVTIVSENTDMMTTLNPAFELEYWRYGLRTALNWCKRLSFPENPKWKEVLERLSSLPIQDGMYVTYEGIQNMWSEFNFEHPALIGIYGMLPGDGVDKDVFSRTLAKVITTWNLDTVWGWDFPMIAMAASRTGDTKLAVDMLLHSSKGFQFDEHGLCTGGPFPYFPANGGLLTAIAMMCGGWDGSSGACPGFPKDGSWVIKSEGFVPMQ